MEIIKRHRNLLLIAGAAVLALAALLANPAGEFAGADGNAESIINEVSPGYTPWADTIWEPPSGEIESLLFALQAAGGSAVIFYIIGYWRGRRCAAPEEQG